MEILRGWRKSLQCFIVLVFVCLFLVTFEICDELPNILKPWKTNTDDTNNANNTNATTTPSNPFTYCTNIHTAMRFGHWRPKPGLTAQDQEARDSMDVFLRRHRGLPDHFLRSDMRCGTGYPINAPSFGPQLPSMCARNSSDHCCNATSWCSSGTSNCECAECTDFRKIVSGELYEWTPNENCQLRNYTSEKACSLVNSRLSSLIIMGDSLMRHFYAALMIIFTNDPFEGSITKGVSEAIRKQCQGERQFVDRGKTMCNDWIARKNHDVKPGKFCNGTTDFFYHYNGSYSIGYRDHGQRIVRELVNNRSKALVVVGVGLHDGLNPQRIMKEYVEPLLGIIGNRTWPRLVWVTIHAQGYLKPMAYRGGQSNDKILTYNQQMTKLVAARGMEVLDFFNLTLGVHSYDGTHYGIGANTAKAQLLLNYIDSTIGLRKAGIS